MVFQVGGIHQDSSLKAIQEMGYPKHVGGMFSEDTDDSLSNAVHFRGVERGSVHYNSLILALSSAKTHFRLIWLIRLIQLISLISLIIRVSLLIQTHATISQ